MGVMGGMAVKILCKGRLGYAGALFNQNPKPFKGRRPRLFESLRVTGALGPWGGLGVSGIGFRV